MDKIVFERRILPEEERRYFTVPFQVPESVDRMKITYEYPRFETVRDGDAVLRREINIIDLALNAPGGEYVGASGSDRTEIEIAPTGSSQGYTAVPVTAGEWEIIVGAYKVAPGGVTVRYTVEFTEKQLRRYQGDLHIHTTASDGTLTTQEVVDLARQHHLDFVFITNHNNYSENECLPRPRDMTVVPGTEWTHYMGHANFLGVRRPYRNPFCVNTREEARAQILEARERGATIVYNHPFCAPECGWKWGFDIAPFDAVEIWNGPLMLNNENTACLEWWHDQLCEGHRIAVIGGSDFHRPGPLMLPGIPCTCLYAMSRSAEDLLSAVRGGHAYIKMDPGSPDLEVHAGQGILGDCVEAGTQVTAEFTHLRSGDLIRTITDTDSRDTVCPEGTVSMQVRFSAPARFVRFEVLRSLKTALPPMRVLVSNPVYFDPES